MNNNTSENALIYIPDAGLITCKFYHLVPSPSSLPPSLSFSSSLSLPSLPPCSQTVYSRRLLVSFLSPPVSSPSYYFPVFFPLSSLSSSDVLPCPILFLPADVCVISRSLSFLRPVRLPHPISLCSSLRPLSTCHQSPPSCLSPLPFSILQFAQ